jgi:hypothetical protein
MSVLRQFQALVVRVVFDHQDAGVAAFADMDTWYKMTAAWMV